MCRVEERIYIGAEGHRSKFEEAYPCSRSRGGRLCDKVKRRTTEYYPKNGTKPRDDSPSPINPPTPSCPGTYLVQQRRPSATVARPSLRDGQKPVKPEIIIEFGSKGRSTKYPKVSVSGASYKRSSLASSVGSSDIAVDSLESDASHTIRTGFPDTPLSPRSAFAPSDVFTSASSTTRNHHRQTSSVSSVTGSSQTPSLYITSDPDYDSPASTRTARYPVTIIHNANKPVSSSPSRKTAKEYRPTVVAPQGFSSDTHTPDGLYPLDYSEFADRSGSSRAGSDITDSSRRKDREERRRRKDEDRRQAEEIERLVAEELARDNVKQVRFELGRAESRDQARNENNFVEKEKRRAEDREDSRLRKEDERKKADRDDARSRPDREELRKKVDRDEARSKPDREEPRKKVDRDEARSKPDREEPRKKAERSEAPKERKKEKSKPPTVDLVRHPSGARRPSLSQAQLEEHKRLLAAEALHMQGEREAAEARERDERNAVFRQQQEQPGYYDPRGGDRMARRTSSNAPPLGITRNHTSARHTNGAPPQATDYSTRSKPNARRADGPPVSFPANFNQDYGMRTVSTRRQSYTGENPFAVDHPFAITSSPAKPSKTSVISDDPWDVRNVPAERPTLAIMPAQPTEREHEREREREREREVPRERPTVQQRGQVVTERSGKHNASRQASRTMVRVAGYDEDYPTETASQESSEEEDIKPAPVTEKTKLKSDGAKRASLTLAKTANVVVVNVRDGTVQTVSSRDVSREASAEGRERGEVRKGALKKKH